MINKHYKCSKISEPVFRHIIKCFALDLTTTETAQLSPASFLINGIWLHHFKKNPYVLSVSEGKFNIKVSSVSKLPAFIEDLYISSGDSVVIDINLEDDLRPLID